MIPEIRKSFRPIGNKLLVRPVIPRNTGPLYIPETATPGQDGIFEVMRLGTKVELPGVKVGDHVVVKVYTGQGIKIDKEDWKIVEAENVVGVYA